MKSIILIISLFLSNAFSATLNASDIDPTNFYFAMGLLASMVLSIILLLLGYRKTINLLGK